MWYYGNLNLSRGFLNVTSDDPIVDLLSFPENHPNFGTTGHSHILVY